MKIDKQEINEVIINWLRWDADLRGELRKIQIKLLHERIIKEMPFQQLAEKYKATIKQVRKIFAAILFKIERSHGKPIANLLRKINTELEYAETGVKNKTHEFNIRKVFLN